MKRFFAVSMTALALASLLAAGGFGASTQQAQATRIQPAKVQSEPNCPELEASIYTPRGGFCQAPGSRVWPHLLKVCAGVIPVTVNNMDSWEELEVLPGKCSDVAPGLTQVIVA